MFLAILLACQSEPANGAISHVDGVETIDVSKLDVIGVPREGEWTRMGGVVAAGSDLDHDGTSEWATVEYEVGYDGDIEAPRLLVFEGGELLLRTGDGTTAGYWYHFGEYLVANDIDGDGHADLGFTSEPALVGGMATVLFGTDDDARATIAADDPVHVAGLDVAVRPEGPEVLFAARSERGREVFRAPGADLGADATLASDPWLVLEDPVDGYRSPGAHVAIDVDGDALDDHILLGFHTSEKDSRDAWERRGGLRLAPLDGNVSDGIWLGGDADLEGVGAQASAIDLDGDGVAELVTAAPPLTHFEASVGTVSVFRANGSPLATVQGDRAIFGAAHTVALDDEGDPWLIVTAQGPRLVGYRGENVAGPLREDQADRVWKLGANPQSLATYREVDGGPLRLVVGYDVGVEVFPFDP